MDGRNDAGRPDGTAQMSRRDVLRTGGLLALGAAVGAGCTTSSSRSSAAPAAPAAPAVTAALRATAATTTIRLATVVTIQDGGLLPQLLSPFETGSGRHVEIYAGEDVYTQARAGAADLVFSHFGHKDAQGFLADGLGQWPRMVLFNSIALIVPITDPAGVAGVSDPLEAFRRIAAAKVPFVVNAIPELVYLADTLWNATGRPDKTGWYRDTGLQMDAAMQAAASQRGYSLWGVTPFLVSQQTSRLPLRPVVYNDEMFHRVMVSVVVNPAKFPRANIAGALALQDYLLTPATQALIRSHRHPGIDQPLFWPAGRNNAPNLLPLANPAPHSAGTVPEPNPGSTTGTGPGTGNGGGTGGGG